MTKYHKGVHSRRLCLILLWV